MLASDHHTKSHDGRPSTALMISLVFNTSPLSCRILLCVFPNTRSGLGDGFTRRPSCSLRNRMSELRAWDPVIDNHVA